MAKETNAEIALKTKNQNDFYKKMNFCPTYFESAVEHFYKDVHKYETRSNSWAQCYTHFVALKGKYSSSGSLSPKEIDEACVRLGFYMASWGMYRGSSFLLQNDYKIYEKIIPVLLKYNDLWELDKNIDKLISENASMEKVNTEIDKWAKSIKDLTDDICDILKDYKHHYITKSWYTNHMPSVCSISKTLVTKLILGTIGCYPAIDSFFSDAVGAVANDLSGDQIKCMLRLAYYVKKDIHDKKIIICSNDDNAYRHPLLLSDYPVMKLIDMYYFTLGMEKPFLKLISDLLKGKTTISELDNQEKKLLKQFIIYNEVTKNPEVNISYPCYPINKEATPCTCIYLTLDICKNNKESHNKKEELIYDDIIGKLTDTKGDLYKKITNMKDDTEE